MGGHDYIMQNFSIPDNQVKGLFSINSWNVIYIDPQQLSSQDYPDQQIIANSCFFAAFEMLST